MSAGLPSRFGFPLVTHPRDASCVFVVPLEGAADGSRYFARGRLALWRSRDAGETWVPLTDGLPTGRVYAAVLRAALAADALDPTGVYFGTTTGQLFGSADEGETWLTIAGSLPPIYTVRAVVT